MKRYIRTAAVLLLILVLSAAAVTFPVLQQNGFSGQTGEEQSSLENPETGAGEEQNEAAASENVSTDAERTMYAAVLGDSIAKGYSGEGGGDLVPYGSLAMEEIADRENCRYEIENFARNGLDSAGMNEKILPQEKVRKSLRRADVIFITVGSNDLLNECRHSVQEILGTDTEFKSADEALRVLEESVKDNPFLVLKIIGALGNWDYQSFEANWTRMMDTVKDLKKENARIIVTNIYNPVSGLKLPSAMNQVVEDIIENMNRIIDSFGGEYGYRVADVFDSEISDRVQSDGLHPDQSGQQLIADLVYEEYESAENGD